MKKIIFISALTVLSWHIQAQKISNERNQIDTRNKRVVVYYDLEGQGNHHYRVSLYSSIDNFSNPLGHVHGDVGRSVRAGKNKRIFWNYPKGTDLKSVRFDVRVVKRLVEFKHQQNFATPEAKDRPVNKRTHDINFMVIAEAGAKVGEAKAGFSGNVVFGAKAHKTSVGLGIGYDMDYGLDNLIPVFFDFRHYFLDEPTTPFIVGDLGYSVGDQGGLLAGAAVGYKINKFLFRIGGQYSSGKKNSSAVFVNTPGDNVVPCPDNCPDEEKGIYNEDLPLEQILLTLKIGLMF